MTAQSIALGLGTGGALVDVTSYVTGPEGTHYQWGRTSEFQDPRTGQCDFVLDNYDGRFTPGNLSAPYATPISEGTAVCWQIGSRLVAGVIIGLGFANSEDQWGRVTVTVGDLLQVANRTTITRLSDAVAEQQAWLWWPMDDPATATSAAEKSGNGGPSIEAFAPGTGLPPSVMTFGVAATGPTGDQLQFSQTSAGTVTAATYYPAGLSSPFPTITYPAGGFGYWGLWVTPEAPFALIVRASLAGSKDVQLHLATGSVWAELTGTGVATPMVSMDATVGNAHYVAVGLGYSGSTLTITVYVDGVAVASSSGTVSGLTSTNMQPTFVSLVLGDMVTVGFKVDLAHLSHSPVLLREDAAGTTTEASRVAALAQACPQMTLGTVDANLSTAAFAGDVTNVFTGFCDVLRAEQGHAYFSTSGSLLSPLTVLNIRARTRPITPVLTLDAALDLEGIPQFVRDVTNMFADVTASGPVASASFDDPAAVARVGSASTSENVGLVAYNDLYGYASDRLVRGENVALHPVSVVVDTLTSSVTVSQLLALLPGDRIRIVNLPVASLGFTTWDGWVVGVDEAHNMAQDLFTLYVAPVLNSLPIFDTDMFLAGGDLSLQSSITAGATSMTIATSDGTLFDTTAQHRVWVDNEAILITSITGTAPQVATITRGVYGTTAAAHNAGALVELLTEPTWLTSRSNYVPNPACSGTSGWVGGSGAVLSASATTTPAGTPSIQVVTGAANGSVTWSVTTSPLVDVAPRETLIHGMWVQAPAGAVMNHNIQEFEGSTLSAQSTTQTFTATGAWQWVSETYGKLTGTSRTRLVVRAVTASVTFLVGSGLETESGGYFDGNTAAAGLIRDQWTGTANASTSVEQTIATPVLTPASNTTAYQF